MKTTILSLALVLATSVLFAQKKTTTSAIINFDATTSLDKLPKAENKTVIASLDTKTGNVAFEVNMKNFAFSNPRIQEHFNGTSWLDSDQFPTSTFKGSITNLSAVNFSKDGSYNVEVTGDLAIHGITKPIKTNGVIVVKGKTITASTGFTIILADYDVKGGSITSGKVSKEPTITVSTEF